MDRQRIRQLYEQFAAAVAYVAVETPTGDQSIGTAFHIGEGIFITAAHVLKNNSIIEIATTEHAIITKEELEHGRLVETTYWPGKGRVIGGPYFHPDESIDVAAIRVEGINAPVIPLGGHLDDWIDDSQFVLEQVVVMGYPPVPFSKTPLLVSTLAEVNAVVDKYTGGHPHFIVSALARGGFSGGVALTEGGYSLGVITESLAQDDKPTELGFLAVLTVEPIYVTLGHHKIMPVAIDEEWRMFDDKESFWQRDN
jgi:S1-C subfamily serine protease